jgi:AcrR family transcriptional regulator
MARTAVLNKQQIIQCAFDIAREKGRSSITIREIGNRLGRSTAPIYTQYSSIDEIIIDLKAYIIKLMEISSMENRTDNNFLNIGVGLISFVIDNKLIFNDFFLTMGENGSESDGESEIKVYIEQMRKSPIANVLDDNQLKAIFRDMQIYTYGLATIICTGNGPNHDLSYYKNLLEQSGGALIGYHLYSSGKMEGVIEGLMNQLNQQSKSKEVSKS